MDSDRIDLLCTQCFELEGAGTLTALRDPEMWVLEFDDDRPCFLMPVAASPAMRLTGTVCPVPSVHREAIYEMLLLDNELNAMEHGRKLSIDAPDGDIIMSVELSLETLSAQEFREKIGRFRKARKIWASVILNWSPEDADDMPPNYHTEEDNWVIV